MAQLIEEWTFQSLDVMYFPSTKIHDSEIAQFIVDCNSGVTMAKKVAYFIE